MIFFLINVTERLTFISRGLENALPYWRIRPLCERVFWVWQRIASDGEAPVLEIWDVWSVPTLPLLPGPLWPWMVGSVRAPYMNWLDLSENYGYSIRPCARKRIYKETIIQKIWFKAKKIFQLDIYFIQLDKKMKIWFS